MSRIAALLPTQPLSLDRDNVFGASCVAAWVGGVQGFSAGNNYAAVPNSGVSFVDSPYGIAQRSGAGPDGVKIASGGLDSLSLPVAGSFTATMLVKIVSLGTRRIFMGDYSSAATNHSIEMEQTAGDKWQIQAVNVAPTALPSPVGSITVTTGWHWCDLVCDRVNSVITAFVDGVSNSTSAWTSNRRAGTDLRVGRPGAYTLLPFDGDIACAYFFSTPYQQNQLAQLRRDPAQIFKTPWQRSRVGAVVAASGNPWSYYAQMRRAA